MKTVNFKVALMMAAVIGSTAFVSCSSDDEDGTKGGGTTSKHIAKMTWTYNDGWSETTTFDYDSQGRVVKKNITEIGGWSSTTTYTYGENTIISKCISDNEEEIHTYTLSNGRIIKDVQNNSYGSSSYTFSNTYDSNGYIISQEYDISGDDCTTTFTWTNGNLTKHLTPWGDNGDGKTEVTISYSDIAWPQNWMQDFEWDGCDVALEPSGVFGKMPKNLPKRIVLYDGYYVYDKGYAYTIDYTIENGEITKIIYQYDDGDMAVCTIEWK